MGPVVLVLILLLIIILVRNIRIVQQAKAYVVERLGAYKTTWNVGIHFKVPFIERVAKIRRPGTSAFTSRYRSLSVWPRSLP